MSGPEKHWTSNRQLSDLANVLRRPVETTVDSVEELRLQIEVHRAVGLRA
jgi:hypothetical protein